MERVSGSIRRECLDRIVIFNRTQMHLSLDKVCPDPRPIVRLVISVLKFFDLDVGEWSAQVNPLAID